MSKRPYLLVLLWLWGCSYAPIKASSHSRTGEDAGGGGHDHDAATDAATNAPAVDGGDDARVASDAAAADGGGDTDAQTDAGETGPSVEPLYTAAPHWDDYVRSSDATKACTTSTLPQARGTCFHGGALRKLDLPTLTSCTNVTAQDSLGAFDWECVPHAGGIRLRTTGLNVGLEALLDAKKGAFRKMSVSVRRSHVEVFATPAAAPWTNPVVILPVGSASKTTVTLAQTGTIYVVAKSPMPSLVIGADHVSLVLQPPTVTVHGEPLQPIISATKRAFLWLEGHEIDRQTLPFGVELELSFSVVHGLTLRGGIVGSGAPGLQISANASELASLGAVNSSATGVRLEGGQCTVTRLTVDDAADNGVELLLSDSDVQDVRVQRAGGNGVLVEQAARLRLHDVHVASSGTQGLLLHGVTASRVYAVSVANSGVSGVMATSTSGTPPIASENITFFDIMTTNNAGSGMVLEGRNHRALLITAANNDEDGVRVSGNAALVMHSTALYDGLAGYVSSAGARWATFMNVLGASNATGLSIENGSLDARVVKAFLSDNLSDIDVLGSYNTFVDTLELSGNTCNVASGLTSPGLDNSIGCVFSDGSVGTLLQPRTIASAIVGKLIAADGANTTTGLSNGEIAAASISDWLTFDLPTRHWGHAPSHGFPSATDRGRCSNSDACAVWDFRVSNPSPLRDEFNSGSAGYEWQHWDEPKSACDGVQDAIWDSTYSSCESDFLDHAFEPVDDGLGNDNGLCEVGETCVFIPNRGAYPGHGALQMIGTGPSDFSGFGSVTLLQYTINGP